MRGWAFGHGAVAGVQRALSAQLKLARGILAAMVALLPLAAQPVRLLDLRTVMRFFTDNKRPEGAVAGVLARTPRRRGYTILLAFLDAEGAAMISGDPRPPTRSYVAYGLADDLAELFGGRDVVVLD